MEFFQYLAPTKVIFGRGTEARTGALCKEAGATKVLIHYGGHSAKKSGLIDRICASLQAEGISYTELGGVVPNPRLSKVYEGIELGRKEKIDFILAVGGGSVIDSAKAIAVMAANPGDLWDYIASGTGKGQPIKNKPLPIVAISTTAGTGSEADAGCVITNPETNEKVGLKTPDLFPVLCIEDPELMKSVPAHYTAYQGFDALSHSLEGYISKFANLMSDMYAITAIENVGLYLARAVKDGNDIEARTHVAFGNILSGTVMCVGTTSSQHSLEHALSAYHPNLPHGAGLIMLSRAYFGNVIAHHACDERFIRMAKAMGMENADKPEDFLTVLQKLLEDCGVADLKMSDYGITPDEFPKMADNAMGPMGGLFACDRVALTKEDVIGIYQKSYK